MTDDDDSDVPFSGLVDDLPDGAGTDGDDDASEATASGDDAGTDGESDDGPAGGVPRADAPAADDAADGEPVADAPLGDLAARVDDRRTERAAAAESELFTEQSAEEVDSDRLWEQVSGADDGVSPDDAGEASPRDERVISKRSYCQSCEYFSEPPDVRCEHDGTEILEVVDLNRFRVVDCPVVREDELLDDIGDARDDA